MFSSNTSQVAATATQAEAIDFDGTNDYLSRSSLIGNSDGKQFTCSAFFYIDPEVNDYKTVIAVNFRVQFRINLDGGWYFTCKNAAGTNVLDVYRSGAETYLPVRTWVHFLISIDLTDSAKRSIYVNDILMTGQSWATYTNDNIAWTSNTFFVGANNSALADPMDGRLSNVFLDYTYRDLSITANRRLFVTADLKPAAGQAALNPILYLPMSDPTTVGTNAGTGGNFTLTGTIARSGRGPNQYNAPYSDLDGSTQYLSRTTAPTGIADGKQVTFSCNFKHDTLNTTNYLFSSADTTTGKILFFTSSNGSLTVRLRDTAGTNVLEFTLPSGTFVVGRNYVLTFSVDLTNTAKRNVYVNGQAVSATWVTYTNANADLTNTSYSVGVSSTTTRSGYFDGTIGALWFNTSYIDLSVASNLAKFVSGTGINAKPVDLGATGELPTGTSPLIYLPMYGNNAGKNYGTGGDFTVNSGTYTGARGPNEFWGNKANFGATTSNYLSRATELVGHPGNVTTATFCCYFYCNNAATTGTLFGFSSAGSGTWQISANRVFVWLGSGYVEFNENVTSSAWHSLLFSRTGSTITAYLDGVALTINSGSSFDYGGAINFAQTPVNIGVRKTGASTSDPMNGQISELYLSSSYIDFSQEANRLKFRDCFGNPVDLSAQITAQSIPTPIVYARFPPTSFGTNSGTGGDFTVSGTITDGGQL